MSKKEFDQSDETTRGDKFHVGGIAHSEAVAIGRGASATVNKHTHFHGLPTDPTELAAALAAMAAMSTETLPPLEPLPRPHARYLIGREAEMNLLLAQVAQLRQAGKCQTTLLLGNVGSGRHALTTWLRQEVSGQGIASVALRFGDRERLNGEQLQQLYRRRANAEGLNEQYAQLLRFFPNVLKTQHRWGYLAAQLLAIYDTPLDQMRLDDPRALTQLLRSATRRQPLLLILEHLERGDLYWLTLLTQLVNEGERDDLPLLVVVTAEAPSSLREIPNSQRTDVHDALQRLSADLNDVTERFLKPFSVNALMHSLNTSQPVAERLFTLTNGQPFAVEAVWEMWLRENALDGQTGHWEARADKMGVEWVFGDLYDLLCAEVEGLLPADAPLSSTQVMSLLACGAVEGEQFTVAAVANVVGLDDLDDVIDTLDDALCELFDADSFLQPILLDTGFVTGWKGNAYAQYRFSSPLIYHLCLKYGATPAQQQRWAATLADLLLQLHQHNHAPIQAKLIALFERAGMPERNEPLRRRRWREMGFYMRLFDIEARIEQLPQTDVGQLIQDGIRLLMELNNRYPHEWARGRGIAETLLLLAAELEDEHSEIYLQACWITCMRLGGFAREAVPAAQRLIRACNALAATTRTAWLLSSGASLYESMGEYEKALPLYDRALAMREAALGSDHPSVATTLNNLAGLYESMGEYEKALPLYERAFQTFLIALGANHPNTQTVFNNYVQFLLRQEEQAELIALIRELGLDHPLVTSLLGD